jgi:hypothetical protein
MKTVGIYTHLICYYFLKMTIKMAHIYLSHNRIHIELVQHRDMSKRLSEGHDDILMCGAGSNVQKKHDCTRTRES